MCSILFTHGECPAIDGRFPEMDFSNYIVYVDESGDHSLSSIDANYPVFVLSFCIFQKSDYTAAAGRDLQDFKFRWFGHDCHVLHESDIVKRRFPYAFLEYTLTH